MAKLLVGDIIAGCSRGARFYMLKWIASKMPGGSNLKIIEERFCILRSHHVICAAVPYILYKIPKIIIGENTTFQGPEDYMRSRGVELVILNNNECKQIMRDFIAAKPELWNEDIGEE